METVKGEGIGTARRKSESADDSVRFGQMACASPIHHAFNLHALDLHAIEQIMPGLILAHAVNIGLEAGELAVPFGGEAQIIDNPGIRHALAGHDQRDAGRIGHHHARQHPPVQIIKPDLFDMTADQGGMGLLRGHRRFGQLGEQRVLHIKRPTGALGVMLGGAQVAQAHAFILAGMIAQ